MNNSHITKGIEANFSTKAENILHSILQIQQENQEQNKSPEEYTIVELARRCGLPITEVVRYIRPETYEPRDYEWLLNMKKYNVKAYTYYLQNHKIVTIDKRNDKTGKMETTKQLYVNFSKHSVLLNTARLMKFGVRQVKNSSDTMVLFVWYDSNLQEVTEIDKTMYLGE